ncbi:hypothetical protein Tsubulata_040771 [Turnera subulata]|uniref:DUF3527 domain-containing protein n=1 Tax=Turnera subulata TaxID=218843 RepID=A0A9Q0JPB5_9ROSI|nr:hypothetical protein Tsubulata_040771 [Turnera subulata]
MAFSLDLKNDSKQQENFRLVRETGPANQGKQGRKPEDKLKSKLSVSQSSGNLPRERRLHTNDGISLQKRASRSSQHHFDKSEKDDELVRYMSSLPGYLQRMDRGENMQDMALNVGVLDWTRLEKWKCKQKNVTTRDGSSALFPNVSLSNKITSPSTSSNTVHSEIPAYRGKVNPPPWSSISSSQADHTSIDAKHTFLNNAHVQHLEPASNTKNSADCQKRVPCTYRSSSRNDSDAVGDKDKRKHLDQRIASKARNSSSSSRSDGKSITKRKGSDHTIPSSSGASSSEVKSHDASFHSKEQKNCAVETKNGTKKLQESSIDISPQHRTGDSKNIVLLVPKKYSSNYCQEEPRISVGENLREAERNSFADSFSHEELYSSEFQSEIPHSCPLPSGDKIKIEPHNMAHIVDNAKGEKLLTDICYKSKALPVSECEDNNIKFQTGNVVETSKKMDQEASTVHSGKGRDPSPNRRFSFSLSRMTRSFSFKEGSTLPQLSSSYVSMKSGPVSSKASSCSDNSNTEKASGHSRARSSPLRRILDPLLKPKGSRSAETAPPLKESLKSSINTTEFLEKEKHETSRIRALLQLTVRNELPLLRFVVDNSSIIAVPLKNLSPSMKNSAGCNYTFYSVDEIKKKSGHWMNQAGKEKHSGYVYNVIGQMKVRRSASFDFSGQHPINQYTVKESVLFGVKLRQADQESPGFKPSGELAAVVVRTPSWNLSLDTELSVKDESLTKNGSSVYFPQNERFCKFSEDDQSRILTAILPGAIHGLPNEGVPSSLIHRWKTGGSCDCGGWDVGCKLRILSNENTRRMVSKISKSCMTSDCYELFEQGGAEQDKPIFNLAPLEKGVYAVDFDSSISSLQAFFICVTVMNFKELDDLVDRSNLSEEKALLESKNTNDGMMTANPILRGRMANPILHGRAPVRYTPNPPLSPVGRV